MAEIESGFSCPHCGCELSAECGVAVSVIRTTAPLRSTESRVWVECENCGREITAQPAGGGLAHPLGRIHAVRS